MNGGRGPSPPNLGASESSPPEAAKVRDNRINTEEPKSKREHVLPSVFEEEKE